MGITFSDLPQADGHRQLSDDLPTCRPRPTPLAYAFGRPKERRKEGEEEGVGGNLERDFTLEERAGSAADYFSHSLTSVGARPVRSRCSSSSSVEH